MLLRFFLSIVALGVVGCAVLSQGTLRPPVVTESRSPRVPPVVTEEYTPSYYKSVYPYKGDDDKDKKIKALETQVAKYKEKVAELELKLREKKYNELDVLRTEIEALRKTVKELKK